MKNIEIKIAVKPGDGKFYTYKNGFSEGYKAAMDNHVPKLCPSCGCQRIFSEKYCKPCMKLKELISSGDDK